MQSGLGLEAAGGGGIGGARPWRKGRAMARSLPWRLASSTGGGRSDSRCPSPYHQSYRSSATESKIRQGALTLAGSVFAAPAIPSPDIQGPWPKRLPNLIGRIGNAGHCGHPHPRASPYRSRTSGESLAITNRNPPQHHVLRLSSSPASTLRIEALPPWPAPHPQPRLWQRTAPELSGSPAALLGVVASID